MPKPRSRLRDFIDQFTSVIEAAPDESGIISQGRQLLRDLVSHDDWLPKFATRVNGAYSQHLLYLDSAARFSVVAFVWAPDQGTPIHNHTVWGLVGVLRGAEISQRYERSTDGGLRPVGPPDRLGVGAVDVVSPTLGDIHQVVNALPDRSSISVHVYGGNIGRIVRSSFLPSGAEERFISGYAAKPARKHRSGSAVPSPVERGAPLRSSSDPM